MLGGSVQEARLRAVAGGNDYLGTEVIEKSHVEGQRRRHLGLARLPRQRQQASTVLPKTLFVLRIEQLVEILRLPGLQHERLPREISTGVLEVPDEVSDINQS